MEDGERDPREEIRGKITGRELPGGHRRAGLPWEGCQVLSPCWAPGWVCPALWTAGWGDSPWEPHTAAIPDKGHHRGGADRVASGHPIREGTHLSLSKPRDSLQARARAAGLLTACPPLGAHC